MSQALTLFASPTAAELLIASLVETLSSPPTQRAYREALQEFCRWTAEGGEPLSNLCSKPGAARCPSAGFRCRRSTKSSAPCVCSCVRLRSAGRSRTRTLSHQDAIRWSSVSNLKQSGARLGKWPTEKEAGRLLSITDPATRIGLRDRAILALLLACGLRREELVRLEVKHLQLRDDRGVLLDLAGTGRRTRTVAVPLWVRRLLDAWLEASGIRSGFLFRTVRKGGNTVGLDQPLSEDAIYTLVKHSGAAIGSAAKPAGNWSRSSFYWAMLPSRTPNAIWAASRTSFRPSTIASRSGSIMTKDNLTSRE